MSDVPSTLFRGSRFIFWAVVPVAIIAALILPLAVVQWSARTTATTLVVELALVLLVLSLWGSPRVAWAGRALCGVVFAAFVAYLVEQLAAGSRLTFPPLRTRGASANNALLGLFFIGLPALFYAVRRRAHAPEQTEGSSHLSQP